MRLAPLLLSFAMMAPAVCAGERLPLTGADVRIWNLAGTATLVAGSGPDVVVDLDRAGADAARLRVATGAIDGAQTLRVVYPNADRIVYRRPGWGWNSTSSMTVRPDGRFGAGTGNMGRRVTVATGGRGLEAHADLRIEVPRGQKLRVYLGVGSMSAENVDGDLVLDISSGDVQSSHGEGSLSVDAGSGTVAVRGHEGELSVDTGSGGVEVTDVRAGLLHVDTGSGSVHGSGLNAEKLEVDTGSGGVDLASVAAADVHVDTGSGGVRLELLHESPRVIIDTGSGGVRLTVPSTLSARLDLDAGSGGVRCSLPMVVHSRDSGELRGIVGEGRGSIRVETGSGGVTIEAVSRRR